MLLEVKLVVLRYAYLLGDNMAYESGEGRYTLGILGAQTYLKIVVNSLRELMFMLVVSCLMSLVFVSVRFEGVSRRRSPSAG